MLDMQRATGPETASRGKVHVESEVKGGTGNSCWDGNNPEAAWVQNSTKGIIPQEFA